jgi:hypothetical protein
MAGDMVTFKLGSVTLGSVDMSSPSLGTDSGNVMVRPKDLAGVIDETDEKASQKAEQRTYRADGNTYTGKMSPSKT